MLAKNIASKFTVLGSKAHIAGGYSTVNINTMNIMAGRIIPTYGILSNSAEEASSSPSTETPASTGPSHNPSIVSTTKKITRPYPIVASESDDVVSVCGHVKV